MAISAYPVPLLELLPHHTYA